MTATNSLIGTKPNQVPRNSDLGELAYQDRIPHGRQAITATMQLCKQHMAQTIDVTSGTFALTVDTASNLKYGWWCRVRNSGAGVVTLPTADGTAFTLFQNQMRDLFTDGTNFFSTLCQDYVGYLHVREEQASGTHGGTSTSATNHVRVLNTVVGSNTINGASLASNIVTLPAGTYDFEASAPCYFGNAHKLTLYNDTDSTDLFVGQSAFPASGGASSVSHSVCKGRFTLSVAKNVKLRHYITSGAATDGLGFPTSTGTAEVYSSAQFWKIK